MYYSLIFCTCIFVIFQGSPWWQEKQVYGTITALRNSSFIHGKIWHLRSVHDELFCHQFLNRLFISFTARWLPATSCWWMRSCVLECLLLKVKGRSEEAVAVIVLTGIVVYLAVRLTCSHHCNSEAPQSDGETAVNILPSITVFVRNHCYALLVMFFFFPVICHCLPLIGLFMTFVKSTDLCHLVLFLPLKSFLASEVFSFVFIFTHKQFFSSLSFSLECYTPM